MKRTRPRILVINGIEYEIICASEFDGFVTTGGKERTMFIHDNKGPRVVLDTFIHEALHASEPGMTERRVARIAKNVRNLLWKVGYRRERDT